MKNPWKNWDLFYKGMWRRWALLILRYIYSYVWDISLLISSCCYLGNADWLHTKIFQLSKWTLTLTILVIKMGVNAHGYHITGHNSRALPVPTLYWLIHELSFSARCTFWVFYSYLPYLTYYQNPDPTFWF